MSRRILVAGIGNIFHGDDAFGVEHFHPQVSAPAEICDYENLLYACCRCRPEMRFTQWSKNPKVACQ